MRTMVPAMRRGGIEIQGLNIPVRTVHAYVTKLTRAGSRSRFLLSDQGSTKSIQSMLRCQDRQAELGVAYSPGMLI